MPPPATATIAATDSSPSSAGPATARHDATTSSYGHLFPGQEADAVPRLGPLLAGPPEALEATGTDDLVADANTGAQRQAQRAGRERVLSDAQRCKDAGEEAAQEKSPKPLQIAGLDDGVQEDALTSESAPCRNRIYNLLIKSQLLCQLS